MKNLKHAARLALIAISILFLASTQAKASHFRYATVDYKPILDVNGNPTGTVEFHIRSGWRRSAFGTPVVGSIISPETFFFGDGGSVTVNLTVTSFSATQDWVIGSFTVQHHYNTAGPFTANGNSGARISTLQNGHDENWRYDTLVFPFSKNNSPTTSLPPVIPVVKNSVNQFFVPVSDLDRDNLQFSIAPRANTGVASTLYPPPGLSIDSTTGLITWNTNAAGVVPGLWFVQIWVADVDANNVVKSRVPIDFLMDNSLNPGGAAPSCLINGLATPGSFSVSPGAHISFTVTGSSPNINPATGNPDTPVTLNVSGLPTGATMTPSLSLTGPSPVSSTFNWTPTAADGGARTVTYTATDSQGRQTFNSVSIFVETNQPPTVSCPSPISPHATSASGANVNVPITVQDTNGDTLTVTWKVDGNTVATHSVSNPVAPTTDTLAQLFSIGSHTVSVSVSDGKAAPVTCSTTVTVSNSSPAAQSQSVSTNEDTPLNITLGGTDADGDTLTFMVLSSPANGSLSGTAPNLIYTPNPNYNGPDSFTFKVNDGIVDSNTATISINVGAVNDPPVAVCRNLTLTTSAKPADPACPAGQPCAAPPAQTESKGGKKCAVGDPSCDPNAATCSRNVSGDQIDNGSSDPDGDELTYALSPAGPFNVGTTPVTLTVTDPYGASSSCTATITVIDDTAPFPTVEKLDDVNGECSVTVTPPTATDNCAGPIQGTTTDPLSYNQPGSYNITWTYDDGHGNTSTQNQQVFVTDTTAPAVPNLPGSPQTFNWVTATTLGQTPSPRTGHRMVYDPVRHKVILFGGHDPAVHPTGNYVLTSHLNDVWELDTATNVWTDVTPTSGPMPVGRADFGMAYDVARNKVVIFGGEIDGWLTGDTWEWDPAAHTWEEKTAASIPVYGGLFGPAMAYDPNRNQVILFGGRAYFNWGQAGTYAWDGTNWIDVTPAVYPLPRFIHAMATDLARSKVVMFGGKNNEYPLTDTWEWNGSSWTEITPTGPVTPAREDPSMAYDAARQITILFGGFEPGDDKTWSWDGTAWSLEHPQTSPSRRSTALVYDPLQSKLVLFSGDLPSDTWYSQSTSGLPTVTGECSVTVTAPVANDNCVGAVTGTTTDPTTYTAQGTYTVHWTYDDGHGNVSTQTQTVIVKDTMPPTPDAASLPDVTSDCSSVLPAAPTATDNCDGPVVGVPDKTGPFGQGDDVITWTFTDHVGNRTTQTQAVRVHDTTAPAPDANSLPDVTAVCSANLPAAPTAIDNCNSKIAGVPDKTGPFGQGDQVITWTFTDSQGNHSTQTQAVHVHDTTAPVPDAASLSEVTGECSASLPSAPTAADACDGRIVGVPDKTGPFGQGDDLITWTFADSQGNRSTQTQAVHVHDTHAPLPDAASLPDVTGECSATINAIPTAADNCSAAINGTTTDPLVYTEQGTYTVTWHFKDAVGNESTQTQKVIVKDTTPPQLDVPADVTVGTGPDATSCSTIVTDATIGTATASDNCGLQSLVRSGVPLGNVFPVGTTTITYMAKDIHGQVTTGTQKIKVVDNTQPVLNVPANITVATAADATSCTAFIANALLTPTASDNCGIDPNSFTRTGVPAGNNFPVGTTIVTYTVKDIYGNISSGTQTVTITDGTLPVINGKTMTLWPPDHQYVTIRIADLIASATDNCDPNVSLNGVVISQVTSDEPENINSGDGNTVNDIVIANDCKSVNLRAERDGSKNGRVYTIYFEVKDSAGNVRTVTAKVSVPKSQGANGAAADDTPPNPANAPYRVVGSCPR